MSGISRNWNIQEVYKLIQMFKERELLWNTSLEENKNRDKKREAWSVIGKEFNLDKTTIEKKMRSLVGQFNRELKKHGANGTSRWFAFKRLMFLYNPNRSSLDLWPTDAESKDFLYADIRTEPVSISSRSSNDSIIRKRMIAKRHQILLRSKQSYNNAPNIPEKLRPLSNCIDEDEFDAFGRNVALQLKQLPLIHALESQVLIQRILKEQRIKALRDSAEKQSVVMYQGTRGVSIDNLPSVTLEDGALGSRQDPLSYCNISEPGPSQISKIEPEW